MKKQVLNTEKLTLNKFKIASISNFGKSKIIGGGGEDGDDNTTTRDGANSKFCYSKVRIETRCAKKDEVLK